MNAFRPWVPDTVLGVLILLAGLLEQANLDYLDTGTRFAMVVVVVAVAAAVACARWSPALSLLLVWFAAGTQVTFSVPLLVIEASVAIVAFGAARWGSHLTVVLSGLSIPVAGALAVYFLRQDELLRFVDTRRYRAFYEAAQGLSDSWQIGAGIMAMACLAVPWMAGLVLRYGDRAATSRVSQQAAEEQAALAQRETEQAQEIARLREEQTQLARDVHDVVGHSLAVILAQAESAQFLDQADTGALRLSMAKIAASARGSLQDVRQVLTSTQDGGTGPGELEDLVEGVRASGHEIRFNQVGPARPLAPELATVAYRVLQEMLTNAIRHGRRDASIDVELHWGGELRIEVANIVGEPVRLAEHAVAAGGHGLDGMRRRLDSVGGRLDVRRREVPGATTEAAPTGTFTATAWVPMRTVYP